MSIYTGMTKAQKACPTLNKKHRIICRNNKSIYWLWNPLTYNIIIFSAFTFRFANYFREVKPTYWLALIRRNGNFEFFSVTDLVVRGRFLAPNVHMGHRLLVNTPPDIGQESGTTNNIVEMGIFGLGHLCRRPVVVMRTADFKVLLYEVIPAVEGSHDDSVKIRLRKLNHSLLLRETKT